MKKVTNKNLFKKMEQIDNGLQEKSDRIEKNVKYIKHRLDIDTKNRKFI